MKKVIVSLVLAMGVMFQASAGVATNPATINVSAVPFAVVAAVHYMLTNSEVVNACELEPLRKVAHASNPNGYTFTVAGCDYQAKKDRLILK